MWHGCVSFGGRRGCGEGAPSRRFLGVHGPGRTGGAPVSGYAHGGDFARSERAFAQAKEWLAGPEAAGLGLAGVEGRLAVLGREIQRQLLQDHLFAVAAAEPRLAGVTGPDGICRTRSETGHGRTLSSIFGPVTASRIAYRAPGAPNVHPADEQLRLPRGKHSPGLAKMAAAGSAAGSLAGACRQVRQRTGCTLGTRQCQELVRAAAADFEAYYASRPRPAPGPGQVLVAECDAKGVKMRPGQLRPRAERAARKAVPKQDGRLSQGEVRTRKRMAAAGAVYLIDPVPRTSADITGPGPRRPGPAARRKWLTASVTATTAQAVAAVFAEADRRDPARQARWIALADGNKDQIAQIQAQAAARGITVTIICDLIHVTGHLWDAAWCFFPKASPQAGAWVRDRITALLDGGPHAAAAIAAALRAAAAPPPSPPDPHSKRNAPMGHSCRWSDMNVASMPLAGHTGHDRAHHGHQAHRELGGFCFLLLGEGQVADQAQGVEEVAEADLGS